MFFLTPRYLKNAKAISRHARKILRYKEDILTEKDLSEARAEIDKLDAAAKRKSREDVEKAAKSLEERFGKFAPQRADAGWRENCEVFLVAIVIAVGIRAYFLQPFKIPTGSMYPTLNGIMAYPTTAPLPNIAQRLFEGIFLARTYVSVTAKADETITQIEAGKRIRIGKAGFLDRTILKTDAGNTYTLNIPVAQVTQPTYSFHVSIGKRYKAGETIAHGYVDSGDHVFVDKFSYNFVTPKRGDVFVFKTIGIPKLDLEVRRMDPEMKSQHYIKRIAGEPNDTLRIAAPLLYIDGKVAEKWVFERVMSCQNGYNGYANIGLFRYLSKPDETFTVPSTSYFALGDNSENSSDSRAWGPVPELNIVGRGFLVYWPLNSHWGPIR